jgi:NAD(P)-dependent dehydrogenase (short-subunit alcohol dehydrogenase family)
VVVVVGAGGIGEAVARRLGPGRALVLASRTENRLRALARRLRAEGNDVHEQSVDVGDPGSVAELAAAAGALGPLDAVVNAAGLSPVMAGPEEILRVDLLGGAVVLDAFLPLARRGTVAVSVSSGAAYYAGAPAQLEYLLATTPTSRLLTLPELEAWRTHPDSAYLISKRANILRVQAAAAAWGLHGARVVSVSPGVTATDMGRLELAGPNGELIRTMMENSGVRRMGTPQDVAAAVEFLISPAASYITGVDLLIDGGVHAAHRTVEQTPAAA